MVVFSLVHCSPGCIVNSGRAGKVSCSQCACRSFRMDEGCMKGANSNSFELENCLLVAFHKASFLTFIVKKIN